MSTATHYASVADTRTDRQTDRQTDRHCRTNEIHVDICETEDFKQKMCGGKNYEFMSDTM